MKNYLLTLILMLGALAPAHAQQSANIQSGRSGDSMVISNGKNAVDIGGLLGGDLKVKNPKNGKSLSMGQDGSFNVQNQRNAGSVNLDSRGSVSAKSNNNSVTTYGRVTDEDSVRIETR